MIFAALATAMVAVLGHFTILALVRHLDPHKALRAYWLALAAGSLVLVGTGCGSTRPTTLSPAREPGAT